MQAADFLMHRYLSALHVPYFGPALAQRIPTATQRPMVAIYRSSGFYRTVTIHAALLIAMELRAQLCEEQGLSPVNLRPDLLAVLDEVKDWCLNVHEAGETNVKAYLLMSLVAAQIDGLRRGLGSYEIAELLIQTVENVGERCLPILEDMAAAQGQGTEAGPDQVSSERMEGLDSQSEFTFDGRGNVELMSWMYDDINSGLPSVW
ncbi:hypothetical protein SI65_06123 [Aspergillus cristatus]|uniref:Transcription factor domain-containing protein n=1 Tax=Aspergillus cristatus TaxID=573508 RepID=A0A1E3BBB0_ASPCR|nr:hypothetical protein SI65_06123 [Aspergillus cristatus]